MKKYILTLLLPVFQCALCYGQLTIGECQRLAQENYPLVHQYDLIALSERYDVANASKATLPQFSLSGRATWQTDVTTIPFTIPGYDIPKLAKDQYQVLAEVSQVVWDGGASRASKAAVRAQAEVERAQHKVDMYAVRSRVDDLFFGILLLDEQLRLNGLYLEDLQVNYDRIAGYMANGVANQADLDAVHAEQLGARQIRGGLQSARTAYTGMLAAFIGRPLAEGTELVKPDVFEPPQTAPATDRPEMVLFDAMDRQMETRRQAINASNMPQIGLFLQGGYGRPGLNMLQNKFDFFALGGIRFSWNFGSLYSRSNNLRKIETGIGQVNVQRETFLFNNSLQQTRLEAEYNRYRQAMADDDEIIRLRGNIVRASEAKFDNGTIGSADLMRDLIAEQNAKTGKAIREIELLQTIYGIKNLTNN